MQLTAGSLLQGGKYLLNHPIETQGFGITYRATATATGQAVVIKTLHPALHTSKAFTRLRDRFVDICALVTRAPQPSLVKVLDIFQEENLPFVVMEYVSGSSLADLVSEAKPMNEMEALHYVRLVGQALMSAHKLKLVHGNLKPQSILRRTGGNIPVVIGYGISADRMLSAVQYAVPGFPHAFTAPEQIGEKGDRLPISDLYGLAANLYFLLTGHLPPDANARAQSDILPHLDRLSPVMQRILLQGMALNLKHRSRDLEQWLNLLPGASVPRAKAATVQPEAKSQVQSKPAPTIIPAQTAIPVQTIAQIAPPTVLPDAPTQLEPVIDRRPENPPANQPETPALKDLPRFRTEPLPPPELPQAFPPYRTEPLALRTQELAVDWDQPDGADSAKPPKRSPGQNRRRMLVMTGCIAATIGGSFGLALRFSAARSPDGGSMFHAGQSFPDRQWQGTLTPNDGGDAPIEATPEKPPEKPSEKPNAEAPAFNADPMIDRTIDRIPEKSLQKLPSAEKAVPGDEEIAPVRRQNSDQPVDQPVAPRPNRRIPASEPRPSDPEVTPESAKKEGVAPDKGDLPPEKSEVPAKAPAKSQ